MWFCLLCFASVGLRMVDAHKVLFLSEPYSFGADMNKIVIELEARIM
jgi:hypothetical protein